MPQKIATCCYCGTRAALVLTGTVRHELSCQNCGAPLHDLKMLPKSRAGHRELVDPSEKTRLKAKKSHSPKKKTKKRKKSAASKFFEEVFDFIEDIFD